MEANAMQIGTRSRSAATTLDLHGRFELDSLQVFNQAAQTVIEGPSAYLVLKLEDVNALDSSALGLIMLKLRGFRRRNKSMTLLYPQGAIKHMFHTSRINPIIPIKESENDIFMEAAVPHALAKETAPG